MIYNKIWYILYSKRLKIRFLVAFVKKLTKRALEIAVILLSIYRHDNQNPDASNLSQSRWIVPRPFRGRNHLAIIFVNRLKFIIDASSSVKAKNFIHSQNFAKNISNTFDLRHGDVRVGVLTYSSTVHDHQDIELGDPINGADDLNAKIDAMPYEHGDTHTGAALR